MTEITVKAIERSMEERVKWLESQMRALKHRVEALEPEDAVFITPEGTVYHVKHYKEENGKLMEGYVVNGGWTLRNAGIDIAFKKQYGHTGKTSSQKIAIAIEEHAHQMNEEISNAD